MGKRRSCAIFTVATCVAAGLVSSSARATSGSWTGASSASWAGANWSVATVPGTGDTATFNTAGNAFTTIDLGAGVLIKNIVFDAPLAAGYTIGNGSVGGQVISLNDGGSIAMSSTVINNQVFNASVALGTNATAQTYSITNNSLNNSLSFSSNITGGPTGGTAGTKTLTVGGAGNTVISGSLLNGATSETVALTKTGSGNLTFNGTVNAAVLGSGATGGAFGRVTVNSGKLVLDFSNYSSAGNANLLNSFSPVTLGGGTLQVIGNTTNASTQSFTNGAGVTFNPGLSTISAAPSSGSQLPTVNLGALTVNFGASVRYVGPATIGAGNVSVPATGIITTTTAGATGTPAGLFLAQGPAAANPTNAYATVGLYDWASTNVAAGGAGTSPYTVIGGSQVAGFYNSAAGWTGFSNIDVTAVNTAITNNVVMPSVRFNTPAAPTLTTGGGGNLLFEGMLVTPNMGAVNASVTGGGTYQVTRMTNPNGGQSATFWQNNTLGFLNFSPVISDGRDGVSDPNSILKAGEGTMVLTAGSSYTGQTYVNAGTLVITADSSVGSITAPGAVNLNGGTLFGNATFSLDNSGANKRALTILGNGGGLAAAAGNTMTVTGVIAGVAGTGPLTIGIPASTANGNVAGLLPGTGSIAGGQAVDTANPTAVMATGTVTLKGAGNSFSGGVVLTGGATLNIDSEWELGGSAYTGITFNNATLQYNTTLAAGTTSGTEGFYQDISANSAATPVAQPVTFGGNATIDTNSHAITFANTIGNGGAGKLTISDSAGTGTLTLAAANTYTGGTLVTAGGLNLTNTTGSATGTGPVAITGGTLSGSGSISGALNISGGLVAPGVAGTTLTVGGLTFNSGTLGFALNGATNTSSQISTTSAVFNATPTLTFSVTNIAAGENFTVLKSTSVIGGGSFLTSLSPSVVGRITLTPAESLDQKSIVVTSSGSVANLIWAGGVAGLSTTLAPQGDSSTWNNTQSASPAASNWNNGGKYDYFYDLDNVTFNDTSTPNYNVNLASSVSPSSIAVSTAGTYTFAGSGSINGIGSLRVTSGTLNLNTVGNTYSGGTNISSGATLVAGAAGVLPVGGNVSVAGILDLNGNNQTIGNLADGGVATGIVTSSGGSSSLTITTLGNSIFGGSLQNGTGTLGLAVAGVGTEVLTGSNSYTGATTIGSGSALQVGNNTSTLSLPSGSAVTDNGTLGFNLSAGVSALGNTIAGTGKLVQSGAVGNILQLSANTYSGGTTINSGTIQLTGATGLGTGDVTIASGGSLDLNALSPTMGALNGGGVVDSTTAGTMTLTLGNTNAAGTFSGSVKNTVGTVNLVKAGLGNQTLSGINSYTGTTLVNAGTLTITGSVGSANAPAGTITDAGGALTINGGTVYASNLLEPNNSTVATVTGNANVVLTGNLGVNSGNNSATAGSVQLLSGNVSTNTVTIGRNQLSTDGFPVPTTTNGLYVNGATLNIATTLGIGRLTNGNYTSSNASLRLDSGSVTVGGTTTISSGGNNRGVALAINGGTFTSNDTAGTGIQLGGTNDGTLSINAELLVTGGTLTTNTITLGGPLQVSGTDEMIATGGIIYIGSGGIVNGGATGTTITVNLGNNTSANAPLICASANWSTGVAMTLANSSTGFPVTFKAADAAGVAHNISVAGVLSGTGGLLKTGAGTLNLSGSNTYSGGTNVSAGSLVLASTGAFPSGNSLAGSSLNVATGALMQVADHGSNPVIVPIVSSLANSGRIDLTNNAMILRNADTSIATIQSQVAAGYNAGNWNGSSGSGIITSSSAMADTSHLTAVGVAVGITSALEGVSVSPNDVLLKYTYYGDTNLDGLVDGSDYARIDSAFISSTPVTGWYNGDFNFDGLINGSDYTLIDNAFNTQGATIASQIAAPTAQVSGASGTSSVPEPATLALMGVTALGLLGRRHRR